MLAKTDFLPANSNRYPRQTRAFTMIELMVVVVIVGILAATALANFIKAQDKTKKAATIDNMHTLQISAEAYATDSGGIYPPTPVAVGPYLPGGGLAPGGKVGTYPTNPLTGAAQETPYTETISDTATVNSVRASGPTGSPGTPGQIGYNQCDAPEGTNYCVTGCADSGLRIGGYDNTIVLSHQ